MDADRRRAALMGIAAEDPELAARLILMTLPAAASRIRGEVAYDLGIEGLGVRRVSVSGGRARVDESPDEDVGDADFRIRTDPSALVDLVTGASGPIRLMLTRRLRIRGKRRRAVRLRDLSSAGVDLAQVVDAGGALDPDVLYRSLPYLIDPAWTKGHDFTVRYEVTGPGGGDWYIHVRDGERLEVTGEAPEGREIAATARLSFEGYQQMAARKVTPTRAMQSQLTTVDGQIHPITLLGRWIDRSQGGDAGELEREESQRRLQAWRARPGAGDGAGPGQGDPGHEAEGARHGRGLLDYRQLYRLWERQNWKAHEIDFSVDREQWVATPREAQESTLWTLGSFYVGEERVTADLAPFLMAAPTGEVELFLATQLVDEARHAVFFDRFGAEVMALSADDLRGRMRELEQTMIPAWHETFDGGLRETANRIKANPDDLDLFVEGICTYHLIIEGVLAMTGQRLILKYMEDHSLYPGFQKGFSLVERDEHRHIAFGVRFLKEMVEQDPGRFRPIIERRVQELVPTAVRVFVPPYAESAESFVSYGYDSTQIY